MEFISSGYYEENKSKFYSFVIPIDQSTDIKQIVKDLWKEHKKAKHIVYAFKSDTTSKSSDDGEPSGTAGRPLLELLYKRELNNIGVIVVRYFGGTKLGAGKLLRAYLSSGINALNKINQK